VCGAEPRHWVERELFVAEVGPAGVAASVGAVVEALEGPFDLGKVELQPVEIGRDLRTARLAGRTRSARGGIWPLPGWRRGLEVVCSQHGRED
jgi:hypothetical protein